MQAALSSLPLYASLGVKTLERLARGARQIHAAKGAVLFSPGEVPTGVYTVVSGLVKIAVPTAVQQDKVVMLLGSGRSFGLSAIFAGEPHIVSAAALHDTLLVHVRKVQVLAAMKKDSAFACEIAASL